jgi:hypothetical protein
MPVRYQAALRPDLINIFNLEAKVQAFLNLLFHKDRGALGSYENHDQVTVDA